MRTRTQERQRVMVRLPYRVVRKSEQSAHERGLPRHVVWTENRMCLIAGRFVLHSGARDNERTRCRESSIPRYSSQATPKPSSRSAEGLPATRIVSNVGRRRTTRRRGRRPGRRPAVIGMTFSSAHMAGRSSRAGLKSKAHDSGQRIGGCTDGITRQ